MDACAYIFFAHATLTQLISTIPWARPTRRELTHRQTCSNTSKSSTTGVAVTPRWVTARRFGSLRTGSVSTVISNPRWHENGLLEGEVRWAPQVGVDARLERHARYRHPGTAARLDQSALAVRIKSPLARRPHLGDLQRISLHTSFFSFLINDLWRIISLSVQPRGGFRPPGQHAAGRACLATAS